LAAGSCDVTGGTGASGASGSAISPVRGGVTGEVGFCDFGAVRQAESPIQQESAHPKYRGIHSPFSTEVDSPILPDAP